MPQNPVGCFLEALCAARAEQSMQKNVVGFECRIGFEFSTPVPIFVLLREKIFPRRRDRRSDVAGEFLDFAETKLWVRTYGCRTWMGLGGVSIHSNTPFVAFQSLATERIVDCRMLIIELKPGISVISFNNQESTIDNQSTSPW